MSEQALYPIREISRLTGINPITLRAWERRYGLIEPVRTDTGHRLYTQEHIDLVKEAIKLTEQGVLISQVKKLLDQKQLEKQQAHSAEIADYPQAILDVLAKKDYQSTKQLVDICFADLADKQLSLVFRKVVQSVSEKELAILEAFVLPKLQTRLNIQLREIDYLAIKPVLLLGQAKSSIVISLVQLWLAENGMFAIVLDKAATGYEALNDDLEAYGCQAVACINDEHAIDAAFWEAWCVDHPSLQCLFFSYEPVPEKLGKLLQTQFLNLSLPFSTI